MYVEKIKVAMIVLRVFFIGWILAQILLITAVFVFTN